VDKDRGDWPTQMPWDVLVHSNAKRSRDPKTTVPAGLFRILDRDLKAMRIPKRDERGRTLDVHAVRTTFGTLLRKREVAGCPFRRTPIRNFLTCAALSIRFPGCLFRVDRRRPANPQGRRGHTTCGEIRLSPLAPTAGFSGQNGSSEDNSAYPTIEMGVVGDRSVTSLPVKRKGPLTSPVSGPRSRGERIRTSDLLVPNQAL
jgi:hypothetical protein